MIFLVSKVEDRFRENRTIIAVYIFLTLVLCVEERKFDLERVDENTLQSTEAKCQFERLIKR